jgi:hypothetical protein
MTRIRQCVSMTSKGLACPYKGDAMKTALLLCALCFVVLTGCASRPKIGPQYGTSDNETLLGRPVQELVNLDNPTLDIPWYKPVSEQEYQWVRCYLRVERLITVRKAPFTIDVMMATCKRIDKDETLIWLYRDEWEDGAIYRKLVLQDGVYDLAIQERANGRTLGSLRQPAHAGKP